MDYQLLELLRQHSLRNTVARQAIFKLLKQHGATAITELRQQTATQLDTASLYRTLNLYRDLSVIQDVVIAGQRKVELTDRYSPHHHHIACSNCATTVALHDAAFERQIESLAEAQGFTHQSHSFEITGLCPACRPSRSAPR